MADANFVLQKGTKEEVSSHVFRYVFEMTPRERCDCTGDYIEMLRKTGRDNQAIVDHMVVVSDLIGRNHV